jgi:adenylate cyclase
MGSAATAPRRFTIRQSLLFSLTVLVLFTSGAVFLSAVIGAFRASEDLAKEVVAEAGLLVSNSVAVHFAEVERSVQVVAAWGRANGLGPWDTDQWTPLLEPLLARSPRVSSIMVASSTGAELLVLRDADDPASWSMRLVHPGRWEREAWFRSWNSVTGESSELVRPFEYDTRGRTYYQVATTTTPGVPVQWTPPTVFFVTRDPGLTAGTHWTHGSGPDTTVVAFDVLLLDLSRITAGAEISEHGVVFVLADTDPPRVVALPRDGGALDAESIRARLSGTGGSQGEPDAFPELPVAGRSAHPVLDSAATAWAALGRVAGTTPCELQGETWWAHFTRIRVGDGSFVVASAAPQSDFVADLNADARRIALVSFLAIIVATAIATRLASGYSRPLESLAEGSRRIRVLDLSQGDVVESRLAEINELANEQERTRAALDSFSKYMPVEIVKDLVSSGAVATIGGERREITILFTDIEGFTTIAESRTAEEVTFLLTDYFETLLETIRAHRGEVNELLGDGVVAYWGAPVPLKDHAARATAAILDCQLRINQLGDRYAVQGKPRLPTRFGVASGEVVVGNIGSTSRLAYAAVGDIANLASRIEGLNRFYGTRLLVSGRTRDLAGDSFVWREVDAVRVKGRSTVTRLFEPLGAVTEVSSRRLELRDSYEAALALYRDGDFRGAVRALQELRADTPDDRSVDRLLSLAQACLDDPPDLHGWDGVTVFTIK